MVFVLLNGNEQDNPPCHVTQIVLDKFQKHNTEFQLTLWLPNSMDFKPVNHISDVIQGNPKL